MRKGDVCWNTAMGASSNEGRVLFDGRMLQDLEFSWDPIGHLPVSLEIEEEEKRSSLRSGCFV